MSKNALSFFLRSVITLSFPPASAPPPSSSRAHSIRGGSLLRLPSLEMSLSLLFLLPRLGALLLSLLLSIYGTYSSLLLQIFLWVQLLLRILLFNILDIIWFRFLYPLCLFFYIYFSWSLCGSVSSVSHGCILRHSLP